MTATPAHTLYTIHRMYQEPFWGLKVSSTDVANVIIDNHPEVSKVYDIDALSDYIYDAMGELELSLSQVVRSILATTDINIRATGGK